MIFFSKYIIIQVNCAGYLWDFLIISPFTKCDHTFFLYISFLHQPMIFKFSQLRLFFIINYMDQDDGRSWYYDSIICGVITQQQYSTTFPGFTIDLAFSPLLQISQYRLYILQTPCYLIHICIQQMTWRFIYSVPWTT